MDPKRSTTKGFLASLGALVLVLLGFFYVMTFGQTDRPLSVGGSDDSKSRGEAHPPSIAGVRTVSGSSGSRPEVTDERAGVFGGYDRHVDSLGAERDRSVEHPPGAHVEAIAADHGQITFDDPKVQKAIELVDQGKVAEATRLLDEVLARDPKNEQALVEMAMINLLDLKQPEVALGYMQKVVEVNPTNQIVLNELVSIYQDQGRVDEGLNYLMDLAEKKPGSSDLTYSIGQLMTFSGREQDAIPFIEKAAQSPVHQTRAYRDLAETYSHLGDPEKSVEYYDKAIASQEKEISERTAAGTPITYAAERLGDMKTDKARALLQKNDIEGAQAILNEVRAQLPNDPNVAQLLEAIRSRKAG